MTPLLSDWPEGLPLRGGLLFCRNGAKRLANSVGFVDCFELRGCYNTDFGYFDDEKTKKLPASEKVSFLRPNSYLRCPWKEGLAVSKFFDFLSYILLIIGIILFILMATGRLPIRYSFLISAFYLLYNWAILLYRWRKEKQALRKIDFIELIGDPIALLASLFCFWKIW